MHSRAFKSRFCSRPLVVVCWTVCVWLASFAIAPSVSATTADDIGIGVTNSGDDFIDFWLRLLGIYDDDGRRRRPGTSERDGGGGGGRDGDDDSGSDPDDPEFLPPDLTVPRGDDWAPAPPPLSDDDDPFPPDEGGGIPPISGLPQTPPGPLDPGGTGGPSNDLPSLDPQSDPDEFSIPGDPEPIPEPATISLLIAGTLATRYLRRRRSKRT